MIRLESVEKTFTDIKKDVDVCEEKLDAKVFVSEKVAIEECVETLQEFNENKALEYKEGDVAHRAELIQDLHTSFCDSLGTNSSLKFEPMTDCDFGYQDPENNIVVINDMLLDYQDPKEIILTELHEIRHDFQNRAVKMPFSVDVDEATIKMWKDNFDHYIDPELDFEAYSKQPVEVDANSFADKVYENAINGKLA